MWLKTSFTSPGYKMVVTAVNDWYNENPSKRQKALNDFLSENSADAFLLAAAYEGNYEIITHEKLEEQANNKIKIPNIAEKLNIKYSNLFTLLQRYCDETFSVKI